MRFDDVECEVLFRPLDTPDDIARVLSLEVTFAVLDEFVQIPREIVDALSSRVGRYPSKKDGGATNWGMWGSSNPGNEDDWWFEYLDGNEPAGVKACKPMTARSAAATLDATLAGTQYLDNHFYFEQPSGFAPEAENIENLPGERAYYTNQAEGKPRNWVRQFLEVRWGYSVVGDPVLKSFDPDLHISRESLQQIRYPRAPAHHRLRPGDEGRGHHHAADALRSALGAGEILHGRHGRHPLRAGEAAAVPEGALPHVLGNHRAGPGRQRRHADGRAHRRAGAEGARPDGGDGRPQQHAGAPHRGRGASSRAGSSRGTPALAIDPSCKRLIRALSGGWRYTIVKKGEGAPRSPRRTSGRTLRTPSATRRGTTTRA